MLFVSLLFACVFVINADVPACNGPQVFNASHFGSSEIWYPVNFTNSQAPLFPDNFNCEYQINVAEGFFAQVTMFLNYSISSPTDEAAHVIVIDSLQRTEKLYFIGNQNFYFIASGGKIKLSTGMSSKVQFGFKLNWMPYPKSSSSIEVEVANPRPVTIGTLFGGSVSIKAETQVSATILRPTSYFYQQYFRSIFFFNGFSTNTSDCLGTGLQLSNGNQQYVSSGKNMTVLFLVNYQSNDYTRIIFQDYENTKNIVQFQGVGFTGSVSYWITLNATNGPVALQTMSFSNPSSNPNIITNVTGTGVLDVYLGGVTKNGSNLLTSYHTDNCQNNLPQLFLGTMKTYVLNSGVATLLISANADFGPTIAFGRKGLIVSGNYQMQATYDQDVSVQIDAPIGYNSSVLRYTIVSADLVPGVELKISSEYKTLVIYNSSNLPRINLDMAITGGKAFNVQYSSHGENNKGLYMSFEVLEKASGYLNSIYFIVAFMLVPWF